MNNQKKSLSIQIIYWISNFMLGASVLFVLAGIVFNILLYTDFFGNDLQLHTYLPGKVSFTETGLLEHDEGIVKIELVEAATRIHFFNTPGFIAKKVGLAMLIAMLFSLALSWFFRSFMKNIHQGNYFNINNIKKLKLLAYLMAGFWLFTVVYLRMFYHYINKDLHIEKVLFTNDIPNFIGILFIALMIWVIAHVFITGLKLKEDQELTI